MSALAHFIEDEGIATCGISLVREHTARFRPPRFLWVPFPLGRPFGAPGAVELQRRVLLAALGLLERDDGPVILDDFPDDAPTGIESTDDADQWVCPVAFPAPPLDPADLGAAMAREIEQLAPWFELSQERRGRSTVGITSRSIEQIAAYIADLLHCIPAPLHAELNPGENLKLSCEDLKAYYFESATAQPGGLDANALQEWFWGGTAAGKLFVKLRVHLDQSPDESLRGLAREAFLPRTQSHRLAVTSDSSSQ